MDQQVHTPGTYDFRQYDRVWQRVAPALEPFAGEEAPAQGETLPAPQVRQEETLPGAGLTVLSLLLWRRWRPPAA